MCSRATEPRLKWTPRHRSHGVTLVELVVVLTLLAIIASVAAIALRDPVIAYRDSQRRAELTDIADGALRRMARDIRRALPNSLRSNGNNLELLLTRTGGRYRVDTNNTGQGNVLDFAAADNNFDTIGPPTALAGQAIAVNDILVVYNLYSAPGVLVSNAYTFGSGQCASPISANCNSSLITGVAAGTLANETRITFNARRFPTSSPGNRFYVVENGGTVSYTCNPGTDGAGNGTGTLSRASGYPIALAQPVGPIAGAAVLANYVSGCNIVYNPFVLNQSLGIASITLTLMRGGESVTLYHEVHVNNVP